MSEELAYPRYALGEYFEGEEIAGCVLLHDSPADQESISIVLLDDFRCLESGKVIDIQRHQFRFVCLQSEF